MKKTWTIGIITSSLIFLFAYTAVSKLMTAESFRTTLGGLAFIGWGAGVLAYAIPSAELCTVLLLLFSRTRLAGLYASLVLLLVFTVYLVYMVLFVPHLPCSCGGVIGMMGWREHIGFNAVLIVLTAMSIRTVRRKGFY